MKTVFLRTARRLTAGAIFLFLAQLATAETVRPVIDDVARNPAKAPFEQVLAFNASLRVSGTWQPVALSDVAPDGHLHYSIGVSPYLYRFSGMIMGANSPDSFSIQRYVILGTVVDDQGSPVEGAALHIGKQIAYTDSSGHFILRCSKRISVPFSIAPEEFTINGIYQVLSAPSEVHAESEDEASDVKVVVRRIPPPQAKLFRQ